MRAAGQRDSGTAGAAGTLTEETVAGEPPRLELARWRDELGLLAGITSRGHDAGPGFDLGLWSEVPVGEVMRRWRLFRSALPGFSTVALGNQVHGTAVRTVGASGGWLQVEGVDGWITTSPGDSCRPASRLPRSSE